MIWFALWAVLVLGAAGIFFLLGRDLWRKARALTRELGAATNRLTEVSDRLGELSGSGAAGLAKSPVSRRDVP
jgi:hypothetical protein